jgi:hypothetical protein
MLIDQEIIEQYNDDPTVTVVIVDTLFGVPLYAYYVISISHFGPGEIQGTLMTPPMDITGPFANLEDARTMGKAV